MDFLHQTKPDSMHSSRYYTAGFMRKFADFRFHLIMFFLTVSRFTREWPDIKLGLAGYPTLVLGWIPNLVDFPSQPKPDSMPPLFMGWTGYQVGRISDPCARLDIKSY